MRRDYIKKRKNEATLKLKERMMVALTTLSTLNRKQKSLLFICFLVLLLPVAIFVFCIGLGSVSAVDSAVINIAGTPIAVSTVNRGVISIPSGRVNANPFLPYRDIDGSINVQDVPAYNLLEPPEVVNVNSDAARVMDTIVTGILFDKYSPSAILNIEGNDYLVKKGDVVNNYKVINIAQDSVTVKLGTNTYTAGIGEILTEGTIHYNDISNLNKKFGGAK